ncbi:hypothetical protein DPMN_175119 [Dreissena polymorpha]|uniref:MACPF domain-containing protein n=1 Tax=Dreissena polymorpha TaxID=45954 RepID=A0A9D4IFR4_DREPO|nr:hypothetical protein DPMN_175119 [Dreissena polymorpha]
MRQDYQLQECQGSEFKQTFPDVDYALLGYNILKGFPLAAGHDPGFTFPIFHHDYSSGGMTADCRYSVPRGLVIIPDVSCVTSFSSTTIQTKYEFSKALSVSASVEAGGWGVSFSASAGYKKSSSEMSTGEFVFIISSAKCNYFFSKLITEEAPDFDPVFVKWVHKLNATGQNPELYHEFFETYGTHFPTEVTFGARFIYKHKMSSTKYESETKSGVNVAVQASYSGMLSAGGGFNMDSDKRQSASDFSKSVETKTITVGAPPPSDGDAMTWASQVQTSPVPTAYKLSSIELLFTERYMGKMNVDHDRIRKNIDTYKHEYCLYLQEKGQVDSCDSLVAGIQMKIFFAIMYDWNMASRVGSSSECVEKCLEDVGCVVASICTGCNRTDVDYNMCFMWDENIVPRLIVIKSQIVQINIFSEKIKNSQIYMETRINGVARGFENDNDRKANLTTCRKLCIQDVHCVAYTHCDWPNKVAKCSKYSKESISGLEIESGTTTYFISSRRNITNTG